MVGTTKNFDKDESWKLLCVPYRQIWLVLAMMYQMFLFLMSLTKISSEVPNCLSLCQKYETHLLAFSEFKKDRTCQNSGYLGTTEAVLHKICWQIDISVLATLYNCNLLWWFEIVVLFIIFFFFSKISNVHNICGDAFLFGLTN